MQHGLRIAIDLRAKSQLDVFYLGSYDETLVERCTRLLPSGCLVLDVGANVGLTSLPLAHAASALGGHVHAFEPVRRNLERLRSNIALNKLDELITVWPFGLSSATGEAQISLREDFGLGGTTGNAAIVIDQTDHRFDVETIPLRTLDELVADGSLTRVDFAKVDIEGHEDYFLKGAQQTLASLRPIIMMEINKPYYARRGVDLDVELAGLLRGYKVLRSERAEYRQWSEMRSVSECQRLDNVFVVPEERALEITNTLNA